MTGHFDAGLQPERTELAWKRTALAIAVGALVALRLLPAAFGDPGWVLAGMGGLCASAALWVWAGRRSRTVNKMLRSLGDRAPLPGGGIMCALSALVFAVGIAGTAVVLAAAIAVGS